MNRSEFLEFHKQFCNNMHNLCVLKNQDYADKDSNPFSNFEKAELLGICSNEAGILVRMMDKVSRIVSFLNKGQLVVKDENVTDSLQDLANYSILLAAYIKSKQSKVIELEGLDRDLLNLFKEEPKHTEDSIFFALSGDYTNLGIADSINKLVSLNKIHLDNEYYYLVK